MKKLNRFLKQYRLKKQPKEPCEGYFNKILNNGGRYSILSVLDQFLTANGIKGLNERYVLIFKYFNCFFRHKYGSKQFKEEFFKK